MLFRSRASLCFHVSVTIAGDITRPTTVVDVDHTFGSLLGMINTVQTEMECFASEFLNRAQLELPWMNKRGE